MEAGVIEDPYYEDNMDSANAYAQKNWYFRRTFNYAGSGKNVELGFEGICNIADIYLNGTKIASHEGMFGGPYVDISDVINKGENTLIVHLYPAVAYTKTVIFVTVLGIVLLGIVSCVYDYIYEMVVNIL